MVVALLISLISNFSWAQTPIPPALQQLLNIEEAAQQAKIQAEWNSLELQEFRRLIQEYLEDFGDPTGEFRAAGRLDQALLKDMNQGPELYPRYILKLIAIDAFSGQHPEAVYDSFLRLQTQWESHFKRSFGISLLEHRRTQGQWTALVGSAGGAVAGWSLTLGAAAFFKKNPEQFLKGIRMVLPELAVGVGAGFGALSAGKLSDYWLQDRKSSDTFEIGLDWRPKFPPSPAHVMTLGHDIALENEYKPASWKTDLDEYVTYSFGAVAGIRVVRAAGGLVCQALRAAGTGARAVNTATGPLKATGYALLVTAAFYGLDWAATELGNSLAENELIDNRYAAVRANNDIFKLKASGLAGEALQVEIERRYVELAHRTLELSNHYLAEWQESFEQVMVEYLDRRHDIDHAIEQDRLLYAAYTQPYTGIRFDGERARWNLDQKFLKERILPLIDRLQFGERSPIILLKHLVEGRQWNFGAREENPKLERFVRRRLDLVSIDHRYGQLRELVTIATGMDAQPSEILEAFSMVLAWGNK